MYVMSDCRYRARPGPILKWRFDLEINSRAILLPSADSSRVKHKNKQTKVCLTLCPLKMQMGL